MHIPLDDVIPFCEYFIMSTGVNWLAVTSNPSSWAFCAPAETAVRSAASAGTMRLKLFIIPYVMVLSGGRVSLPPDVC